MKKLSAHLGVWIGVGVSAVVVFAIWMIQLRLTLRAIDRDVLSREFTEIWETPEDATSEPALPTEPINEEEAEVIRRLRKEIEARAQAQAIVNQE